MLVARMIRGAKAGAALLGLGRRPAATEECPVTRGRTCWSVDVPAILVLKLAERVATTGGGRRPSGLRDIAVDMRGRAGSDEGAGENGIESASSRLRTEAELLGRGMLDDRDCRVVILCNLHARRKPVPTLRKT